MNWLKVGAYAGMAFLLLFSLWYLSDRAFARGVHSRDVEVANLTAQIAQAAVALNTCNAAGEKNKAAAAAQRAMADAALKAATDRDEGRSKELATAIDKLRAAQATPDCKKAAEVELCPAMSQY